MALQITGNITMTYETEKQLQERSIAEFWRRLREAPAGTRVYVPAGDLFKDADVHRIDELRGARWGAVVHDDDEWGDTAHRQQLADRQVRNAC